MQEVLMDKVTVNMGVGAEPEEMKKGMLIMQLITGKKPCKTVTQARIPDWGLRPGVEIGIKVTLRGNDAMNFLKRAFLAKLNKMAAKSFDKEGNFGFGVREYIDLPDAKYDPKLGIKGF
ncbi:MAG: 50S ribosomal protein L5, partial [archaeon]